jgi:hypothetical protein
MRVVPASGDRVSSGIRRMLQTYAGISEDKEYTKLSHLESDKCLKQLLKLELLPGSVQTWMMSEGYPKSPFVTSSSDALACDMHKLGALLGTRGLCVIGFMTCLISWFDHMLDRCRADVSH